MKAKTATCQRFMCIGSAICTMVIDSYDKAYTVNLCKDCRAARLAELKERQRLTKKHWKVKS